jgi:Leucine-rich repeat (LRR) protein
MISHNSMESLSYALWNYTSLNVLLLDNNKIGDLGAKLLASCVSSMNLVHLNVAFNDIGSEGVAALLHACLLPVKSSCMSILNISGSTINTDVARLLADLICKNSTLNELSLDRANISSTGERYIAGGIASNRHSALVSFTGFDLGEVLTSLGSPPILAGMSNKKALAHLADMWRAHDSKEVHEVRDVSAVSSSTSVDEEYTLSAKDSGITAATLLSAKDVGAHIATSQGQHEMKQVEETQAGLQMYGSTAVSLLSISNELLAIDGPPSSSSTSSGGGPHLKAVEHVAPSFHKYLHALHEISYLPFIAADLWSLHQFYFSPSPIIEHGENTSPDDSDSDSAASPAPRRGSLTVERPKKRQSNVRTMARIAGYPRLKVRLNLSITIPY